MTAAPDTTVPRLSAKVRETIGLAVMLTGTFVAVLDNFIVFVAIPSIRSNLGASFGQAEFVIAAYTLTFALGVITGGRLGDRFGRRRMFIIGLAAFTIASGLCGMAVSPEVLILSRIVQGLSSAVLSPQVLAIIRVSFAEPQKRAAAFAWMGVVIGLASVSGQLLGGLLVAADLWGLSWRPVFLINIPVGLLALSLAPSMLVESRAPDRKRLDLSGAFLSALGLGLLLYPLGAGREAGWPSWCFGMMALSALVLILFVIHQRRKSAGGGSPLLEMALFRERSFWVGALLCLLFYATLSPMFLSFTLLVQLGFGASPLRAALDFSPLPIAFAIASLVAGRLTGSGAGRVLMSGVVLAMLGVASAWGVCAGLPSLAPASLIPSLIILGVGQGLFMTPITNVVLSGIHEHHAGAAAGMLTTMQRAGNALGVAALEIPFFATIDRAQAAGIGRAAAYIEAFGLVSSCVAVILAFVTALLFLLPRGRSAAPH